MRSDKRDLGYLWDMREAAREVVEFIRGVSLEEYASQKMLRRAVERDVELIGEAASRISAEFREAHAEIPWRRIIGQRQVLAHDYGEIVVDRIYRVATQRVPELLRLLEDLVPEAPEESART